jgi:hypothetical protein
MKRIGIEELRAFETGAIDPAQFPHEEHIRYGYEMLGRYSFGEAIARFARGLKLVTARAGKPELYHETITVAFLALINERRARDPAQSWDEFKASNIDLLDKRCLERWYEPEQLASNLARGTFCLPKPLPTLQGPSPVSPAWRGTRRRGAGPRSKAGRG